MNSEFHSMGHNPPLKEDSFFGAELQAQAGPVFPSVPYIPKFPSTSSLLPVSQFSLTNSGLYSTTDAEPTFLSLAYTQNFPSTSAQAGIIPAFPDVHLNTLASVSHAESYTDPVLQGSRNHVPATRSQSTATQETLNTSNVKPQESHPQHIVEWYLLCWNAVILNGPRRFVPQIIYQPHSQGDKERYVALAALCHPIIFRADNWPEWGVPLESLLSKQPVRLFEGNGPVLTSCGPSISIRMQWPGYQPCHKQIATRDYTPTRRPISKFKLAKLVAKCIKYFMQTMSQQPMEVSSDRRWRVGPLDITVDDVILVSLHHISQGSWQPQLRLRR
ncbi:hypothetical protein BS17DRAFT_150154 [Gyrodon lividus]|nr:hypothetical protein BS17DRAFT_150154 [Gyrodon lividus]